MHKPICTPFSFFPFRRRRRFPAGDSRIPTLTCTYVYIIRPFPRPSVMPGECESAVGAYNNTCVRVRACIREGKENKRKPAEAAPRRGKFGEEFCVGGTWATLRAKGVFWWRHAASDQWFLRRPSARPRKYASTSWRHRRRHFRRNWPHHRPRRVEATATAAATAADASHDETFEENEEKMLVVDAFSATYTYNTPW